MFSVSANSDWVCGTDNKASICKLDIKDFLCEPDSQGSSCDPDKQDLSVRVTVKMSFVCLIMILLSPRLTLKISSISQPGNQEPR